uniref:THAP-type domain-containing protein n=1 Tax=Lutzomyia longipalpis TaxID=7200 RepID=A0A1B0CWC9_LUTLO
MPRSPHSTHPQNTHARPHTKIVTQCYRITFTFHKISTRSPKERFVAAAMCNFISLVCSHWSFLRTVSSSQRERSCTFPMNREMGIRWIKALGWRNRYVSCHHRICSEHFEERFLDKSLGFKTRLTKDAVPTIFGQKVKQPEEVEEQIEEVVLEVPE